MGASPAPGIRYLYGDGPWPDWDISRGHLRGAHGQARQGRGEVGSSSQGWWYPQGTGEFPLRLLGPAASTLLSTLRFLFFSAFIKGKERKCTDLHTAGDPGSHTMQRAGLGCGECRVGSWLLKLMDKDYQVSLPA